MEYFMREISSWFLIQHQAICSTLSKNWETCASLAKETVSSALFLTCASQACATTQASHSKRTRSSFTLKVETTDSCPIACRITLSVLPTNTRWSSHSQRWPKHCWSDSKSWFRITSITILTKQWSKESHGQSWSKTCISLAWLE